MNSVNKSTCVSFFVAGKPQGKARPRFTRTGHTYTPDKTRCYEQDIALSYTAAGGSYHGDKAYIKLKVTSVYPLPKRANKSVQRAMLTHEQLPSVKPDIDNILKAVLDSLNGIAYADDKQVICTECCKVYGERAGLSITLEAYEPQRVDRVIEECLGV